MSTAVVRTPTSRCLAGVGRVDITPPIGVYHRMWGAAKQDRATGIHRPLTATALVLEPTAADPANRQIFVAVDHCLLRPDDMDELLKSVCKIAEIDTHQLTIAFSHTHAGGHLVRARGDLPGGEFIGPYLDALPEQLASATRTAVQSRQPAVLTYAETVCAMGRNRDYRDSQREIYVCGFNPDDPHADAAGYPLGVVRISNESSRETIATVVNYPCHPTTLAWDNTLISPDYVGALRDIVERQTGSPCIFLLAPCGDVGPRDGFVGDVAVADRNGRQVGFAALSALESMPSAGTDQHYVGPVISGATIGEWEFRPQPDGRRRETEIFRRQSRELWLEYRDELSTLAEATVELSRRIDAENLASSEGHADEARRMRAMVERQRRYIERIKPLPPDKYPYRIDVRQLGDGFWIVLEGEPYHELQAELRRRFPGVPLIFTTVANGSRASYLPRREDYAKPLYQVEISLLAAGALERITEEIAEQIERWRFARA